MIPTLVRINAGELMGHKGIWIETSLVQTNVGTAQRALVLILDQGDENRAAWVDIGRLVPYGFVDLDDTVILQEEVVLPGPRARRINVRRPR